MGSGEYVVRRAEAADDAGVTRELMAYLAFLGETLDADHLDHDVARWQEAYDGERGVLLVVAAPGGEVVGTAAVRQLEPGIGEIKRMWLRPEHRGQGLGRRLMDACLDVARRLGGGVLRLDSERRLETALGLYRAYGFAEIPDYNGNPRADVWMERRL